jgi:flagellar protein FlbD
LLPRRGRVADRAPVAGITRNRQVAAMIKVTKVDGEALYINHQFIETMEASPNTTIKIHNGTTFVVLETIPDILAQMRQWDFLGHV